MKITLILPNSFREVEPYSRSSLVSNFIRPKVGLGNTNLIPPLSLLALASVTPTDMEVTIVDERLKVIDYEKETDLVGISVMTIAANRAYKIADEYRKRRIPVVLGGIHPTALPEEALQHADAVVIGEGEKVWHYLLRDVKIGKLQSIYIGEPRSNLDELEQPRRDLLNAESYLLTKAVMATRGCENSCIFCSNGLATGKKFRKRSVSSVIEELKLLSGRVALFADDNLAWDVEYAKELFEAMIPLRIKWFGQVTLSCIEDEELVRLMARSGCITIGTGFESVSTTAVFKSGKKRTNDPNKYRELVKRIHKYGISVMGYFILGFDQDDTSIFASTVDFIRQAHVEIPVLNILIPYPGTPIYKYLDSQGRLLTKNWSYYSHMPPYVVFRPAKMSPHNLLDGYRSMAKQLYKPSQYIRRFAESGTLFTSGTFLGMHVNGRALRNINAEFCQAEQILTTSE